MNSIQSQGAFPMMEPESNKFFQAPPTDNLNPKEEKDVEASTAQNIGDYKDGDYLSEEEYAKFLADKKLAQELEDEKLAEIVALATQEPDETAKKTLTVFSALFSISDGIKRTKVAGEANYIDQGVNDEIEDVWPMAQPKEYANNYFLEKKTRIRTFQKDVVFFDYESPNEEPAEFKNVLINIFTIFGKIFIGGDYFFTGPNQLTLSEMNDLLTKERDIWKEELIGKYIKHYAQGMDNIFHKAAELIKRKTEIRTRAVYMRIFLLGMIGITIGAKLTGRKYTAAIGGIGSVLTTIYMLYNYSNNTIEEAKEAAELKKLVEISYKEAGKFREDVKKEENIE